MTLLIMGILPLLLFVILDAFTSLKTAISGALVCGLLELIASIYYTGTIDWITVTVFLFLVICGLISIKMQSPLAFKLQPAVVSLLLGSTLLISSLIGKPIMAMFYIKYHAAMLEIPLIANQESQIGYDNIVQLFARSNWTAAWAFLLHVLLMVWAAFKLSKWWWVIFKAIGPYVLLAILFFFNI